MREGWSVAPDLWEKLPKMVSETLRVASDAGDWRSTLNGVWALLEMDKYNLRIFKWLLELREAELAAERQEAQRRMVFGKIELPNREA